ncbi:hypothetical protein C1N32_05400 [Vibrio diazotrophicus]|uniref:Uncharacterized protein n=1 Tax=Vibrio diazotrophicus TaxID=685 RepID=A0A2J8I4U6_VIBDI|nr:MULTISPECIES: DUF2780 domain-containing protein [Vibrio]MCF7361917.1 DUF2780 domain-containing protein [Vibrio sp. A1-b2]PNI05540.1 hypothetical protein C1N32_05400 [Vibrio diazotrophicus]
MKTIPLLIISVAIFSVGCESNGLSTDESKLSTNSVVNNTEQILSLVNSVSSSLNISNLQAYQGVTPLLSYAQNELSQSNRLEFISLLGGMFQTRSSDPYKTIEDVQETLSHVGLNVAIFNPIILQYFNARGASSALLSELSSLFSL